MYERGELYVFFTGPLVAAHTPPPLRWATPLSPDWLGETTILPGVTEETRHARPDEVDEVRQQHPILYRVSVEQVNLQRSPGEAYDDEP